MKQTIVIALGHTIAATISVFVFTGAPIVLYAILVIIGGIFYNDIGGLLNFVLVPLLSLVLALATTFVILLPIAGILQWICWRFRIPKWLPVVSVFPASLLVFSIVVLPLIQPVQTTTALVFLVFWCLVGSVCFAVYWIPLNLTEVTLFWLLRAVGSVLGTVGNRRLGTRIR